MLGGEARVGFRAAPEHVRVLERVGFRVPCGDAAHAARCAEDQGKYWEMRDLLFANANKLGRDDILEYAANLSLDVNTFQSCVDTEKYADAIQTDITTANSAGITRTPTFVLGKTSEDFRGVKLVGAQPFKMFEIGIKELLAAN